MAKLKSSWCIWDLNNHRPEDKTKLESIIKRVYKSGHSFVLRDFHYRDTWFFEITKCEDDDNNYTIMHSHNGDVFEEVSSGFLSIEDIIDFIWNYRDNGTLDALWALDLPNFVTK